MKSQTTFVALILAISGPVLCQYLDPKHIYDNATFCCSMLSKYVGDKVSFEGDQTYTNQQSGINGTGGGSKSGLFPACRVTPTCASEVAQTVGFFAAAQCKFAVRGGGHTAWPGAANIGKHGITIDLSALNKVVVSDDQTLVRVGGGARWLDVYLVLDAMGLSVSGGRVAEVGVGGLTLGGGKSFFASIYGFACDNVVNFELVTGRGRVLQVNNTSYPDLFKALKGGSNNFGIVTHFDLRTFTQGQLWGGQVIYDAASTATEQYNAFYNFVASMTQVAAPTADAQVIFAYVRASIEEELFANYYTYTLPEAWPSDFSGFEAIEGQLLSTLRTSNLSDFTIELGAGTPNGLFYLFGTLTFENDLDFFLELKNISDALFEPLFVGLVPDLLVSVVLQPLTPAMLRAGCGTNSLGLCPGNSSLVFLDLTVQWGLEENSSAVNVAAVSLIQQAEVAARQRGILNEYLYLNYALERQDPISSYGAKNVADLKAASQKYDPSQVFQELVPGGFKLW